MGRMLAAWAATIGLGLLAAGPALAQDTPAGAPGPTQADWVTKPSGDDMAEAYPPVAASLGVAGHVLLGCKVATTGRVEDCKVTSETPPGFGFGAAALKVAPLFQMAPSTVGGSATVSDVRIPIRFAMPKPDAPKAQVKGSDAADPAAAFTALQIVALVLLTIVSVPAAAAVNDRLRRRDARTAGIGPALSSGFGLVGPALRRAPVPLAIYAGLVALSQIVGPAPGPAADMPGMGRLLAVLPLVLAGAVLAYGGCYRVAFQGRGDPGFRIRRLGLQIGRVEGRLFLSGLVSLILFLVGEVGLGVLGVLAFLAVRAAAGPGAPVVALALGPCLLAATGLLTACRLSTFVPAWVAEGRERLGAGWAATRACLLPPIIVGLVVVVLMGVVLGGLAMPVRVVLEELAPGTGRLVAGVLYGALAVLFVPIRVGVSAYFYEALQAPEPG